jgi:hypothetical protein
MPLLQEYSVILRTVTQVSRFLRNTEHSPLEGMAPTSKSRVQTGDLGAA